MRKILIDLWHLFKELLLLVASIIVFIPLGLIGMLHTFGYHVANGDYKLRKQLSPIIRGITLAIDGFGNSAGGELLNHVNHPKIKYGKWYQTISAVTGINQMLGKDTRFRRFVDGILGKNHCKNAITGSDKEYYGIDKK